MRLAYGRWFEAIAGVEETADWIVDGILTAENAFSRAAAAAAFATIAPSAIAAARHDLRLLQELWLGREFLAEAVQRALGEAVVAWDSRPPRSGMGAVLVQLEDWADGVEPLAAYYRQQGVGLFGRYRAARWHMGQLVGVGTPDALPLEALYGCDRQKELLCQNTEALLVGQPALNVLLYGARGTGKSSLVKGLLHRYGDRGLRVVELSRSDLRDLLQVVDRLAAWPQSFVLFVDDLSFAAEETEYKQLKVMLEGDIAARPKNVCLYATSNRRHLIKEYFSDRPNPSNDEVHAWDSVQEQLSLSDRFGLTLTFTPFTQANYFATVNHLADLYELSRERELLRREALTWAQQQNGFSGRTARQFIDRQRALQALAGE